MRRNNRSGQGLRRDCTFAWRVGGLALVGAALLASAGCRRDSDPATDKNQSSAHRQSPGTTSPAGQAGAPAAEQKLTPELLQRHSRGVALMQQYDFDKARAIFAEIVKQNPHWTVAQVDLAIATLNRGQKGDYKEAASILDDVLKQHPDNLRAAYCQALLYRFFGDAASALPLFQQVAKADPKDGYAAYYIGQCLMDMSKLEQAYQQFRRAQQIDPYLRSAYYDAFRTAQRLGYKEDAKNYLQQFQKLDKNPQARLAEIKYTRMGPKAEVRPIDYEPAALAVEPTGPVFAEAQTLPGAELDGYPWRSFDTGDPLPNITACDINSDEQVDLFVARALEVEGRQLNAVLLRRDDNTFQLATDHPLAKVPGVNTALWGDYDNDGLTDVYLCRYGPNQLWRQVEPNKWQDVTASTETGGGQLNTVDGAMFDADHDGDLDLLLANDDGPNELLNNNLDGTFRPLAKKQGLAGSGGASRAVVVTDLDNDRDVDLVVINQQPPHEVYLNDRLWAYHAAEGFDLFCQTPITAALAADSDVEGKPQEVPEGDWSQIEASVADTDVDGQIELFTLSAQGVIRWAPDATGSWVPHPMDLAPDVTTPSGPLAIQDVDGNGRLDLVLSTGDGWLATGLRGQSAELFRARQAPLPQWTLANLDVKQGPSLVGLRSAGPPLIWNPGPGRHPFAAIAFTGREDRAEQMRSNVSGIGVKVSVRVGGRFTAFETYRQSSGPGQSLQPVAVGFGQARRIDFVRMTWPDGIFQTEIDLGPGTLHRIEETQRQVSSCPVVFAWNGRKYQFVTDVLGVGGIGFNVGAGEYPEPRPWENVLMPPGVLMPIDDRFKIKIGEPMEEACYLDAVRLVAYDLPPGWHMSLDERFAADGPGPTGQPVLFRHCLLPLRAVNDRGQDVTEQLRGVDQVAAPPGRRDRRFVGRTDEHCVTLTFDQPLDQLAGRPVLLLSGWIEYPYSQTMFAAWQAGADYRAPTVEARGADGRWHPLLENFGYVAGMPREASVPLPMDRLPAMANQLRIRTNMEIYWDRVAVVGAEPCDQVIRRQLRLVAAKAQDVGFAARSTRAQRVPYYDYEHRLPLWDTQHQAGFYTRFGPILPLVEETDDAVAIIGPGEEVQLEFAATRQAAADGWTRRFVLETNGWCKDRDLYTRDGDRVGPLPRRRNAGTEPETRRQQLHQRYNTRYRMGG